MPLKATEILEFSMEHLRRYKDPGSFWLPLFGLHWNMAFSGHFDLARDVMELFFSARPKRFTTNLYRELQTLWDHAPSTKPANLPSWWPRDTAPYPRVSEVPAHNIFDPIFYMAWEGGVETWEREEAANAPVHGPWKSRLQPRMELFDSRDDWLAAIHRAAWALSLPAPRIDLAAIDAHSWRESTDHHHIAACARVLCRVPRGKVPAREVMEEAYSAMKRIWELPFGGVHAEVTMPMNPDQPPMYFDVVFPSKVFFWFCVRLRHIGTATAILQDIVPNWGYPDFRAAGFSVGAEIYELCLKEGGFLNLITREGAEECLDVMRQLKQLRPPRNPPPTSPPPTVVQSYTYNTIKNILMAQDHDGTAAWFPIFDLHWKLAFSGHLSAARSLFETYLPCLPPDFLPYGNNLPILRALWAHAPAAQPSNIPAHWPHTPPFPPASSVPERNIFHPSFYSAWDQLCARRDRLRSVFGHARQPPAPDVNPHSWRTLTYTRDCAACVRLLCRAPDGGVPAREALEEAFEAMEHARMVSAWPGCEAFEVFVPEPVYFAFCVGLGKKDKVREVFLQHRGSYSSGPSPWNNNSVDHREWSELYELCFGEEDGFMELITAEDAEELLELVLKEGFGGAGALQRGEQQRPAENMDPVQGLLEVPSEDLDEDSTGEGRDQSAEKLALLQELLEMPWRELLRRFSEAAFATHRDEYLALPNPPKEARDILLPPISPPLLAEVEGRLGPLPPDLRAMVVVANGFRGLWHTFGGGFPPLEKFEVDVCDENWLSFMGDALGHKEPREEGKSASIWIAFGGTEESDDYTHIICPAETWRKLVGDGHDTAGEYRITHTAHWDSDGDGYKGMREWLAGETLRMEDLIAKRERGEGEGESDAEDGSDMEEGSVKKDED